MAQTIRHSVRSEKRLRGLFGYVALALFPTLLMLVIFATKYHGLQSEQALEHAQLARNVATGKGWTTSVVRPVMVALGYGGEKVPDTYNAPVHPLILAAVFKLWHPAARVAAATGAMMWLLSVWVVYFVARSWWNGRTAGLAVTLYCCNVAALQAAVSGTAAPLMTICVVLAVWLALPWVEPPEGEAIARKTAGIPAGRTVLAGVMCGVAVLTHYLLVALVPVLLVCVAQQRQRKWLAVGWFVLGFVVALVPWWVVTAMMAGSPFSNLYSYELMAHTSTFPGGTLWRTVERPPNPLWFALGNPFEMLRKTLAGVVLTWQGGVPAVGTLMGVLFVAAWLNGTWARRCRSFLVVLTSSVVLGMLAVAMFWAEREFLMAWAPLVAMAVASAARHWVREHVGAVRLGGVDSEMLKKLFFMRRRKSSEAATPVLQWMVPEPVARTGTLAVVIGAVGLPLLGYVMVSRGAGGEPPMVAALQPLKRLLPEGAIVATDQPGTVSWYVGCRTVWLWPREKDWTTLEQTLGQVDAIYVTPAVKELARDDWGEWWQWIVSPRGVYRELKPSSPMPAGSVTRVRLSEEERKSPAMVEIDRLRRLVERAPSSSETHVWLATRYLGESRLRDAFDEFLEAAKLEPENTEAVLGQWQTVARLNDSRNSVAFIQNVTKMDARDPSAHAVLQGIADGIESALVDYPRDPWLLFHAAMCQAKLQAWGKADAYCRRVGAIAPQALPAWLALGNLYFEQGLYEQAGKQFQELVRQQPNSAASQEALGRAMWELGARAEALKLFEKARQLRPDWRVPYLRIASAHLGMKKYAEAEQSFQRASEKFPGLLPAQFGLAEVLQAQGKEDAAIAIYEKVRKSHPDNPVALNNLAYLLSLKPETCDRALELARQAVEVSPGNAAMLDTYGWLLLLKGQNDEAISQLGEAARLSPPDNGTRHFHLAKALLAAKQYRQGAEALRMAMARGGLSEAQHREAADLLAKLRE